MSTPLAAGISSLLAVLGVGALLRKEFGPFCLWAAPRLASWAAHRLPEPWAKVREEEWLETLDSMKGMRLFRLFWALGFCGASFKLQPRRDATTDTLRGRHRGPRPSDPRVRMFAHSFATTIGGGVIIAPFVDPAVVTSFTESPSLNTFAACVATPSGVALITVAILGTATTLWSGRRGTRKE